MTADKAQALIAELSAARDRWLDRTMRGLEARSVWLAGYLGRGGGDAFSDLDLIVVDGDFALSGARLSFENTWNGPADGRHVGAMYPLAELTLWIDWYRWPADAALPRGSRRLAGAQGRAGDLDLLQALDSLGRGAPGEPVDPDVSALAMLPLAAKFVASGAADKAESMARMLGADADVPWSTD